MRDQGMARMPRPILTLDLMVIFVVFLGVGVLSFSPAYGGPETLGQSPEAQSGARPPRDIPLGVEQELEQDTGQADADVAEMATNEKVLPVMLGEGWSSGPEAAALRQKSGFDAFNAGYQNKWAATFSQETGRVRVLYGAASRPYKNGPEAVARGFLKDTSFLFGLKPDLSDLAAEHVYRTPERDHVRLQQTYNGVPIDGALVLVHATPQGQVTMVQNGYRQGFEPANGQTVALEAAAETAFTDLLAVLGKEAILAEPQVEPLIAPYQGNYYYIWRVAISTENPIGYWIYHIDAESGAILYKANEILSVASGLKSGKGRAYKTNADWLKGKISNVSLKYMYPFGHLYGVHADIYDYYDAGTSTAHQTIYSPTYTFLFDPITEEVAFAATHAYYQMETVWAWWNKMMKQFNLNPYDAPDGTYFLYGSIPAIVNVGGWCNAAYHPSLRGVLFGDANSCYSGSANLVYDNSVVRHEYTHAIMDWFGFTVQFGGHVDGYGRAMGEGNADFGAFLNAPQGPLYRRGGPLSGVLAGPR